MSELIEEWIEKKLKDAGLWFDDCLQTSLELLIESELERRKTELKARASYRKYVRGMYEKMLQEIEENKGEKK